MKKRILSLVLTLALCAGLLVVPAGARDMGKIGERDLISAGDFHAGAIDAEGSLWMWGSNNMGQLGNGTTQNAGTPVKVMDNVIAVSCAVSHTAAIQADGSLWVWGEILRSLNSWLQAGEKGSGHYNTVPVKVLDNAAAVSCGYSHVAAILTDGSLWTWGENSEGQLGNGTKEETTTPIKIMDNVAAVSCGVSHTAAVKTDGSLWIWGYNKCGQLGNGTAEESLLPVKVMDNVAAVCCGNHYTAAIQTDGSLWMWGLNEYDQLGFSGGNDTCRYGSDVPVPCQTVPVKVFDSMVTVSCGHSRTAAIMADGSLWMWGRNNGVLGNGEDVDSDGPTNPVKVLDNAVDVSCGEYYTAALLADGTLWTWGNNGKNSNRLGYSTNGSPQKVPRQVPNFTAPKGVRIHLNGGIGGGTLWTSGDGKLQVPTNPTKEGYTFGGWYTDEALTIPWNFDSAVSGNVVLYAKWNVISSTATTTAQSTQSVTLDGKPVQLQGYTLQAPNGGDVTYVKLRDVAALLDGTAAQFNVEWRNGAIYVAGGKAYTSRNGTELEPITVLDTGFRWNTAPVLFDGVTGAMEGIVITDVENGGHTFFKLRDLAAALGFNVGWSAEKGVFVETDKPYDPNS